MVVAGSGHCTFAECPAPDTGRAYHMVTDTTVSGGQDWSPLVGMVLCHSCFTRHRLNGALLRSQKTPAKTNPPSSAPKSPRRSPSQRTRGHPRPSPSPSPRPRGQPLPSPRARKGGTGRFRQVELSNSRVEQCENKACHQVGNAHQYYSIGQSTRAGNQDWSSLWGTTLCNHCYSRWRTKGSFDAGGGAGRTPSAPHQKQKDGDGDEDEDRKHAKAGSKRSAQQRLETPARKAGAKGGGQEAPPRKAKPIDGWAGEGDDFDEDADAEAMPKRERTKHVAEHLERIGRRCGVPVQVVMHAAMVCTGDLRKAEKYLKFELPNADPAKNGLWSYDEDLLLVEYDEEFDAYAGLWKAQKDGWERRIGKVEEDEDLSKEERRQREVFAKFDRLVEERGFGAVKARFDWIQEGD